VIPKIVIDNAACKGHPFEEFYTDGTREPLSLPVGHICFRCPVMDECREHGLHHEAYGTWGGMTEAELFYMRQHLRIRQPPSGMGVRTR
jgi:hypothetical protein